MTTAVQGLRKKRKPVVLSTEPVAAAEAGIYLSLYTDLKDLYCLPNLQEFLREGLQPGLQAAQERKCLEGVGPSYWLLVHHIQQVSKTGGSAARGTTKEENFLGGTFSSAATTLSIGNL